MYTTELLYSPPVTSPEFKRWLAKQGCTFESGHGGHLTVRLGTKVSTLPMHGKGKELGTGLVNAIKKDLGLKWRAERRRPGYLAGMTLSINERGDLKCGIP